MMKKLPMTLVVLAGIAVLGISSLVSSENGEDLERRTVTDLRGEKITVNIGGDTKLQVMWVDSRHWFEEDHPVGQQFYESLSPAKPACPRSSEGEKAFWEAVQNQRCSVILYDENKEEFRFVGFVQRSYGETNEGTDMSSSVAHAQEKFGSKFMRTGKYNF